MGVPPVRENTEHRSVSAVPPVYARNMEVDSVLRFLHNRRVGTGQNNPDNPKKGISTESMSLEEYAQKDIRERKEKEMVALKDIRLKKIRPMNNECGINAQGYRDSFYIIEH